MASDAEDPEARTGAPEDEQPSEASADATARPSPSEADPRPASSALRWPFLRDDRAPSIRWPWSRSVLGAAIGLLLPFVWVVEASECGSHATTELTGEALVRDLSTEDPALWVTAALVLFSLAAPWIAAGVVRQGPRLALHVVGALGALMTALFGAGMLLVTLFATRTLRAAGYLVVAILVAYLLDGLVRLGLGVREWRAERRTRDG